MKNRIEKALAAAIAGRNDELRYLTRDGRPLYADDIMAEKTAAIKATYANELARLAAEVTAELDAAGAELTAGRQKPYSWLTAEELQRANLLKPFIDEDIARGLTYTGDDRAAAWLHWRAAAAAKSDDTELLERAAWPDTLHAAEARIEAARSAAWDIEQAAPDYEANILKRYGIQNYA